MRPLSFALVGLVLAAGCVSAPSTSAPTSNVSVFAFSPPKLVDADRDASEPSLLLDPAHHAMFIASPAGLVTRPGGGQSYLWRSKDDGATWTQIGLGIPTRQNRNAAPGGGDTDLAIDAKGTLYYLDLWLGDISVSTSTDGGDTWLSETPISSLPVADRQWGMAGPHGEFYVAYHAFYPGVWVAKSTDGGLTYATQTQVASELAFPNPLAVDPRSGAVYLTYAVGDELRLAKSTDAGATFRSSVIAKPITTGKGIFLYAGTTDFANLALDDAGGLHVAWASPVNGTYRVWYAHSEDAGTHWSAPIAVSDAASGASVFPWIEAGGAGKVDVAWLATNATGKPDTLSGDWSVEFAQSLDAGAHWSRAPMVATPVHHGSICTEGTACSQTMADRRIGDFFTLRVGADGLAHAAYSGTLGVSGGGARVFYVSQTAGSRIR